MKTEKQKERFIKLRAEGLSYDKISKQLDISKPTLINWNYELELKINDLKFQAVDSLINDFMITKEKRTEFLIKTISKVHKEIEKRTELKKVPLKDLISIENNLIERLQMELKHFQHTTDKTTITSGGWDGIEVMKFAEFD